MRFNTRYLKRVGYPLVYVTCFVAFAYTAFPYERLKQRIVVGYNAAQVGKAAPRRMQIGELSWSWRFPGIIFEDIELIGPKPEVSEGDATSADAPDAAKTKPARSVIHVDELYASVSLLSALAGSTVVDFKAVGFDGELSGTFESSSEQLRLEVEFIDVDPGQMPGLSEALQLPLVGRLNGSLSLDVPESKYSKANGEVELQISDLEIGDGKTKVRGLFALPTLEAGTLTIEADIKDGKVALKKFEASGRDLDVTSDGKLRLRDDLAMTVVEQMNIAFKFSDKFRDKNDTTRSLLGKPGDKIGGIIDLDPQMKRAKKPDGFYRWRMSGPVSRLRFAPGRAVATKRGRNARKSGRPKKK